MGAVIYLVLMYVRLGDLNRCRFVCLDTPYLDKIQRDAKSPNKPSRLEESTRKKVERDGRADGRREGERKAVTNTPILRIYFLKLWVVSCLYV